MRDDSWVDDVFDDNQQVESVIDLHISFLPINNATLTQFRSFLNIDLEIVNRNNF